MHWMLLYTIVVYFSETPCRINLTVLFPVSYEDLLLYREKKVLPHSFHWSVMVSLFFFFAFRLIFYTSMQSVMDSQQWVWDLNPGHPIDS